ncbi:MAG: hypothetical protein WC750_06310 [Patescibacteria group bacterium]|jgi:hypothetical protein
MFKNQEIGDTVNFWFAANTVAGTAGDGASPLYVVRQAGAAAGAAKKTSGTPTLLTHADYYDGIHEIAIDTAGWATGEYAVFCSLTISSVNPSGFCGSFKLRTAGTAIDPVLDTVLADTNELQTNQGNWLTATGFSTFDPTSDQVVASNMRGTDNAALATVCTETRLAQLEATALPADIADILTDTGTTLDGKINAIKLKTDTLGGAGAITWIYTLTDSVTGAPIDGAELWVSSDSAGTNILATGITDDNGRATFYLDAGTVFVWRKKAGYDFTNPDQETVS